MLATIAAPVLTFLSAPILARLVGVEGRGTLAAVVSMFVIVRYLSSLGGEDAALAAANWHGVGVGGSMHAVGRWTLKASLVVVALAWLAAPVIFPLDDQAVGIFRSLLVLVPLGALSDGWRAALTTGQRSFAVVVHILSVPVVRLVGVGMMVASGATSVSAASWVSVGGVVVGFIVVAAASVPEMRRSSIRSEHDRRFRLFARRLAPGQAARLGNLRLDQVLLAGVAGASQLGLYAVAVAAAEAADVFTRTTRQIAIRSIGDEVDFDGLERMFRAGLVFWLPTSVVLMAAIPFGVPWVFGDEFGGAVLPAQILILAGFASYVRDVLGLVLIRSQHASHASLVQVVTLVVVIVTVMLFGPIWGAKGAAIAALTSYLTGAVLVLGFYRRERGLQMANLIPRRADVQSAYRMVRP